MGKNEPYKYHGIPKKLKEAGLLLFAVVLLFFLCFKFWPSDSWIESGSTYGVVQNYDVRGKTSKRLFYDVKLDNGRIVKLEYFKREALTKGDRVKLSVFTHKKNKTSKKYRFVSSE